MNVAVIYGGKSGEHEISLVSAAAVVRNMSAEHTPLLIGITKGGRWYAQSDEEVKRVRADGKAAFAVQEDAEKEVSVVPGLGTECFRIGGETVHTDVVFPVLHGTYGEDGTVQGLLEMAGVPFVGCETMASSLTMDKEKTKAVCRASGLPVVPAVTMRRTDLLDSRVYDKMVEDAIRKLGFPLFVKPCKAGSSDGASKVLNARELSSALMEAFMWDDKVLIEKAINARELECAVTGNSTTGQAADKAEAVVVRGPGEIILTHEFYDYNAKYNDSDGVHIPADIPEDIAAEVRTIAQKAYKAVDAAGYARVDLFLDKDNGALYLNEINSIPGFTSISMFPMLCEHSGLAFTALIDTLIAEALAFYKARGRLCTSRQGS